MCLPTKHKSMLNVVLYNTTGGEKQLLLLNYWLISQFNYLFHYPENIDLVHFLIDTKPVFQ